jgi:glycosyltransferase involved in cell wall biosynthesis
MKILYVHTSYEQQGGEDQVFANEVALMQPKHEVRQLLFNNGGKKYQMLFKFLLAPYNPISRYKFERILKKEKPDLVHIHNWHFCASPALILAAKKSAIPLVLTLHNFRLLCPSATLFHKDKIFVDSLNGRFPWKAVKEKVYRNSYLQTFWLAFTVNYHKWRKTWEAVNQYITLSSFAERLYLESGLKLKPEQLTVKPNFVSDPGYAIEHRGQHFLFVGRLCVEKGVHHLLDAFKVLPYQLTVVGDGPLREYVETAATVNSNIQYRGKQESAVVLELMKSASALIFPSIWFEGMPITILEAFATGTPVIAGRLGVMQSLITHEKNGILYEAGDANALHNAISSWASKIPASRREISKAARKEYERHYTPEANLNQILTIYNSVIKNN